jgi:mannitol/fructose-specific phosphotransferase system IIA component (Ntr-type)
MDPGDMFGPQNTVPDMQARDRWQAIDELIAKLVASGMISAENRDAITAAVKKRESSISTGIGFGIGIPHASTDLVTEVVCALGRSKTGIDFAAQDHQPVKTIVLFLVPHRRFQQHLHTLANIAKVLHRGDFR